MEHGAFDPDQRVRLAAFDSPTRQNQLSTDGVLPCTILATGFNFDLPDGHPRDEPIVPNGLALCKLHHAAFDRHILGIRPDLVVEVRLDILREADGPILRYGLQEVRDSKIIVPHADRLRPRREFLGERFELPHLHWTILRGGDEASGDRTSLGEGKSRPSSGPLFGVANRGGSPAVRSGLRYREQGERADVVWPTLKAAGRRE